MAVIPVFISSTFRDFHAERDQLIASVLPILNDRIAEFGCRAELIDLRWGVTASDDDDRQARVLEVCLTEIDRSRPLFIGLLGDRYGWIPEDFRLANAALEAGLSDYPRGISVTALEFEYGALRGNAGDAVFLEREVVGTIPADWRDQDPARATALKSRIREHCAVHSYHLDPSEPSDLDDFVQCAARAIGDKLVDRAVELVGHQTDPVTAAEGLFFEDRLRAFGGRSAAVSAVVNLLGSGAGVCLSGQSGAGKSAMWCAVVQRLRADGRRVVAVPVAASPEISTLRAVLLRVCTALESEVPLDLSMEALEDHTRSVLAAAAPVVLAVDGIDQIPSLREPTFLGNSPSGVSFMVSTTELPHARYAAAAGLTVIEVDLMTTDDSRAAVQAMCASSGRSLPQPAVDQLVAEPRTPLWLRLAIGELSALDAEDFNSVDPEADPLAEIARLVTVTVRELPSSVGELIGRITDRAIARFGADDVGRVIAFAAVSRSGLRPIDFEQLTGLNALTVAGIRRAMSGLLIPRGEGGRLGFTHAVVRDYLASRFVPASGDADLHFLIAEHLAQFDENDPLCREDRLWHLFRSGRSVAPVLNRTPFEPDSRLATVVLDSLTVPRLDESFRGVNRSGVHFLSFTAHLGKMAVRSEERVRLGLALFAAAQGVGAVEDLGEAELASIADAAGCLADLPMIDSTLDNQRHTGRAAADFTQRLTTRYPDSTYAHRAQALIHMFLCGISIDRDAVRESSRIAVETWQWIASREPGRGSTAWLQYALIQHGELELRAGNIAHARTAYEQALPLTRELLAMQPGPQTVVNVVNALRGLADVARAADDRSSALEYLAEAADLASATYAEDPARGNTQQLADAAGQYGLELFNAERIPEAHPWLDRSCEMFRRLVQIDPQNARGALAVEVAGVAALADITLERVDQARLRMRNAIDLAADPRDATLSITRKLTSGSRNRAIQGNHIAAEALALEALMLLQKNGGAARDERAATADALEALADTRDQHGGPDAAAAPQRQAVGIRRDLAGAGAGDADLLRDLAVAQTRLSYIVRDSKEFADAVDAWRPLVIADGSNLQWRRSLGHALTNLAKIAEATQSQELWEEVATVLRPVVAADPRDMETRRMLGFALTGRAASGPPNSEAEALLDEAIRLGQGLVDDEWDNASNRVALIGPMEQKAVNLANARRYREAAQLLLRAADFAAPPPMDHALMLRRDSVQRLLRKLATDLARTDGPLAVQCAERATALHYSVAGESAAGGAPELDGDSGRSGSRRVAVSTSRQLAELGLVHPHLTRPAWLELAIMVPLWFVVIVVELLVFL